jgi:hypothetical protein
MIDPYLHALKSLHAAMTDYLLLLGEPCPLLGQLNMRLIELIGCLPHGNDKQSQSMYRLAAITLEASILGVVDRLNEYTSEQNELVLRNKAQSAIQSVTDCMKVTESVSIADRCSAFFNILGVAMAQLKDITKIEYPQLTDGDGKVTGS